MSLTKNRPYPKHPSATDRICVDFEADLQEGETISSPTVTPPSGITVANEAVNAAAFVDKGAPTGTAQSGTGTTIVLASGAIDRDDEFNGKWVHILSGTGAGQEREITDSSASDDTLTVATWGTNPDNTSVYVVFEKGSKPWVDASKGVLFDVSGGTDGTTYDITVSATNSNGNETVAVTQPVEVAA